jgi:hypothetical protein
MEDIPPESHCDGTVLKKDSRRMSGRMDKVRAIYGVEQDTPQGRAKEANLRRYLRTSE